MELKQYEVSQHGLSNIADDIGKIEEEKMKLEMSLIEDKFRLRHMPTVQNLAQSDFTGTIVMLVIMTLCMILGVICIIIYTKITPDGTQAEIASGGVSLLSGLLLCAFGLIVCIKLWVNVFRSGKTLFGSRGGIFTEKSESIHRQTESLRNKITAAETEVQHCNEELQTLYNQKKSIEDTLQSDDFWTSTQRYADKSRDLRSGEENFFGQETVSEPNFSFSMAINQSEITDIENRELKESIEAQIKWMESEIAYTQKQLEEIQQRQLQIEYDYKEIKRNIIIFVSALIGYDVLQNILAKGFELEIATGGMASLLPLIAAGIFMWLFFSKWEPKIVDYMIEHDKKIVEGYAISNNRVPLYREAHRLKNEAEIEKIKLDYIRNRLAKIE